MKNTENEGARDLLSGRIALVAGGTGNVGRRVVRAFLEAGATVVVPSRSERRIEGLKGDLAPGTAKRLITMVGDLSDEADSVRVRERVLERVGPLDAVVASLGRLVPAPSVLEAPPEDLKRVLDGYLLAHFMAAKTLLPALRNGSGSYTFINGPLAFEPLFPGTGLVSIATAAQAMLARLVMDEGADAGARINEVVIHTRFGGSDEEDQDLGPVSREDVARFLVQLASDRGAGLRGERIHLDSLKVLKAREVREVRKEPVEH